jgi:hypothetical protein
MVTTGPSAGTDPCGRPNGRSGAGKQAMPVWLMDLPCERCGDVHNPWGVHAGQGDRAYEIWVTATGSVESVLRIGRDARASERQARRRFASELKRFVAEEECPSTLKRQTVMLHLSLDSETESESPGLGYGPLFAPEHLHRSLGELIDLALNDLSRRP